MYARVLNKHTDVIPKEAVYIGRPSKWGNPFPIDADNDRNAVIRQYALYLRDSLNNHAISRQDLLALDGKHLVCHCAPQKCHGDVIMDTIDYLKKRTRNAPWDTVYQNPLTAEYNRPLTYAGIGSRETPAHIQTCMTDLARELANLGWRLRTGGAKGADHAFLAGAGQENTTLYLPWYRYNGHNKGNIQLQAPEQMDEARRIISDVHPAWQACSENAKQLHGRNAAIILDTNLDNPVHRVIAWSNGMTGGTATGIKLAALHDIPIHMPTKKSDFDQLLEEMAEQAREYRNRYQVLDDLGYEL